MLAPDVAAAAQYVEDFGRRARARGWRLEAAAVIAALCGDFLTRRNPLMGPPLSESEKLEIAEAFARGWNGENE